MARGAGRFESNPTHPSACPQDRRGAAYHEAGHIVVAWALGLTADAATIGIDGDEFKGKAEIADDSLLPLIDRIHFVPQTRRTPLHNVFHDFIEVAFFVESEISLK